MAQSAEQRFCKPQVVGSSPTLGSLKVVRYVRKYSCCISRFSADDRIDIAELLRFG